MLELAGLGLGTAPLGGLYEPVDDETAHAVVEQAWHLGIRYFDTAPYYGSGLAERRLGTALRGKPREQFVVSTKVGRLLDPDASDWRGAYFDFSYDAALRSLEQSLARLGLDRVDVALVHDPDEHYEEALAGAYRALARLREEGVVRAIGVGMNQTALLCRFAREADPDCFLVAGRYTLLDRSAGDELLPLCAERGIAVIAGGVFNSGVLAGGNTFDYQAASPNVLARAAELRETCARFGVPLPAAAVQFPPRNDAVACVLVGCRTPAEVEEDVRLFELDLPPGLWDELA
ncbi:MAG TPA: aldo/keto reductase [Gaiellaceae bacterium]|nr:aldo/keto reductase [Gaiellaceae bacterium]